MKRIQAVNGYVTTGYELSDLPEDTRRKVLAEHAEFLAEIDSEDVRPAIEEAERLLTPWFFTEIALDTCEEDIVSSIEVNEYLFDQSGDLLPITEYTDGHPKTGTCSIRIHGKEVACTISEVQP